MDFISKVINFIISLWKYNWCDGCGYTKENIHTIMNNTKEFPIYLYNNCINKQTKIDGYES